MPVGRGQADAQCARRLLLLTGHHPLGLHQLGQRLTTLFVVASPALGQADAAGGTDEQSGAQALFQAADRATDRCRRHARRETGRGEAAQLRRQTEQLDAAE
ncbi:hypothetical protein D9M71_806560 [compost metagenome]